MLDASAEEMAQRAYDLGSEYEGRFRHCAQATIAAVHEALGIEQEEVLRAATGLAGGGGKTCAGSCGGFVGGSMIFGQLFGRGRADLTAREPKDRVFRLSYQLYQRYIQEYGTVICCEIHRRIFGRTFDLWDDDDRAAFDEMGAHTEKCTAVVGTAARWIAGIILREQGYEVGGGE